MDLGNAQLMYHTVRQLAKLRIELPEELTVHAVLSVFKEKVAAPCRRWTKKTSKEKLGHLFQNLPELFATANRNCFN